MRGGEKIDESVQFVNFGEFDEFEGDKNELSRRDCR